LAEIYAFMCEIEVRISEGLFMTASSMHLSMRSPGSNDGFKDWPAQS
jgi:hypothetical protein